MLKLSASNVAFLSLAHTKATYLSEWDKVLLQDVNGLRYSLFKLSKSFFRLIKLTDAKLK